MKYLVVFSLCLLALVYAEDENFKKEMKEKVGECSEELGISESRLEEWKQNKDGMSEDDIHKAACLGSCILKKFNMMDDNELKMDVVHEKIDELHSDDAEKKEKMTAAVNECAETVTGETDPCHKGGKFLKCVFTTIKHKHDGSGEKSGEQ